MDANNAVLGKDLVFEIYQFEGDEWKYVKTDKTYDGKTYAEYKEDISSEGI